MKQDGTSSTPQGASIRPTGGEEQPVPGANEGTGVPLTRQNYLELALGLKPERGTTSGGGGPRAGDISEEGDWGSE